MGPIADNSLVGQPDKVTVAINIGRVKNRSDVAVTTILPFV